jgi:ATP-dependent DNA helicase RecQ
MMVQYCQSARCRTRFILEYFGEPVDDDWVCGNCDACDEQRVFAARRHRADAAEPMPAAGAAALA